MFCPSCGKENAKGSKFCEFCGSKLSDKKEFKLDSKSKMLALTATVILLLIFGCYKFLSVKYGPKEIAKDYFLATMNANSDLIYNYLNLDDKEFTSKKIFKNVYKLTKQDLVNYSVVSSEKSADGLTATVRINYTLRGDTSPSEAKINLIKSNKNKYLIFENWEINDKLVDTVSDFELKVPKNSKVMVEDIYLNKNYKVDDKNSDDDVYKLPELFKGKYNISLTLENGLKLEDDVVVSGYSSGGVADLKLIGSDTKLLERKLPQMIEKLYDDAINGRTFDDVKKDYEFDSSDLDDFSKSYDSFMKSVHSGGLKKFEVKKVKINDSKYDSGLVKVTVDVDYKYTASVKILENEKESSGENDDIMYFTFDYYKGEFKLVNISSMAKFFV